MTDSVKTPLTQNKASGSLSDPVAESLVVRVAMDNAELAYELEAYLLAMARQSVGGEAVACERCQGNGEIVTDWDAYLSPPERAPGDAGTTTCPDCDGQGTLSAAPTPTYKPGDRVTRTGESARGLVKGETYVVSVVETSPVGWLMFDRVPDASFNPRGFRPADEEGKT